MATDSTGVKATAPALVRQPLAWVSLALLLGLLGTTAALVWSLWGGSETVDETASLAELTDGASAQVQDAARDYALALASVDYRTVEENRARAEELATAEFGAPTSEIFDIFASTLTEAQSVSTATAEVGVESIAGDTAVALVFLDQTAVNVVYPTGQAFGHRMRVELVREDGQWLVNQAEFR